MQFIILAAGKPALPYAKQGVELYLDRLKPFGKTELKLVKAGSSEDVSARLLEASQGCLRIAMDERGELWTTEQLVKKAKQWQMNATKRIAFLIGASDGHTQQLRDKCDHLLALSKFTLQHELALVTLLEQLYRCHTVLAGTPYHR